MIRPPPIPNRPAKKPDAIPLSPNTANISAVLMESLVCRDLWRSVPLADLTESDKAYLGRDM